MEHAGVAVRARERGKVAEERLPQMEEVAFSLSVTRYLADKSGN